MTWNQLKSDLYYLDGSLRDIYVLTTTEDDWRRWVALVNATWPVQFIHGNSGQLADQIDFAAATRKWTDPATEDWYKARIQVRDYFINCHFFWEGDIEVDVAPADVRTPADHDALLAFMEAVSAALQKPVRLTPENEPELALLEIDVAKSAR